MFFRHLNISAQTISLVRTKFTGISNAERIPVDNLDLKHPIIDPFYFFLGLLLKEKLSLSFFLHSLLKDIHTLNQRQNDIVSILVGMFNPIEKCNNTFLLIADIFDDSFKGLLSIVIIDLMCAKISKINATCTFSFSINKFNS